MGVGKSIAAVVGMATGAKVRVVVLQLIML